MKNILVINGNPARERITFSCSLANAYAEGAMQSGHSVVQVNLARLDFDPILHEGYTKDQPLEPDLISLRAEMIKADHWVLVFPIWLSLPPALVKGFLERTLTRGFAFDYEGQYPIALPALKGKTIRIIITCGAPSFIYRWFSGAPTSKALRTIFKLCGMKVLGIDVFGPVTDHSPHLLKSYGRYIDNAFRRGKDER
jgi:putative NADPH-quinone reductase